MLDLYSMCLDHTQGLLSFTPSYSYKLIVFLFFSVQRYLPPHVLQNFKVFSAHGVFLQICSSPWNHLTSIFFCWQVDRNQRLRSIGKLLSNKFLKNIHVCVYVCVWECECWAYHVSDFSECMWVSICANVRQMCVCSCVYLWLCRRMYN